MTAEVTLADAISNIELLVEFQSGDQRQPCIQASGAAVLYQASFDTNFQDNSGFITGMAKYKEEAVVQSELNKLLEEGKDYAIMLYTWRSCSRAIPAIKSNDQPDRMEIYDKILQIFEPELKPLKNFMYFQDIAIERFCQEARKICHQERRKDFVSETYFLTMGKFINMFAVLDSLKNMKSSIKNDYALYRRASQCSRRLNERGQGESQKLAMFLAQHNQITQTLKKNLESIPGYEDLLIDIVNCCVSMYEDKKYLLPQEKHMLLKVMGFGLYLADSSTCNIYKLEHKKQLSLSKIDKFFKNLQVVPLYGDMQIELSNYIAMGHNYKDNQSKWTCTHSSVGLQYNLVEALIRIREEHDKYISDFAKHSNDVFITQKSRNSSDEYNKELYVLSHRGVMLLSKWSSKIMELYSWKLVHPVDKNACPGSSEDYERATRYNYTSEEKLALIEVIAMVKGVQALLLRMEGVLMEGILRTIYNELQTFVQHQLRDAIRYTVRKKKTWAKAILLSIRETAADWLNGQEPVDDLCLKGEPDLKSSPFTIPLNRRSAGPSSTQLYMVRTMLESLIIDRSAGASKKPLRKDLPTACLPTMDEFHAASFFYTHMMNFNRTVIECCDLSQLWFREFFLEMTMGEHIQFPIEMSMPWILTDHILETKDSSMMEYVLYPLDLYNDSAQYSLTTFKKQFLYDEVEAEVNLCFDQFAYKLSEQIFQHYKCQAASILLDQRFSSECANFQPPIVINYPASNRYSTLLKQHHVQILGRSIDLNHLLTQRIRALLMSSLEYAITRYEGVDITGIIDLYVLIDVNRMTHKILSEFMKLPDFDAMFKEADNNVLAPYGRVTLHTLMEVNSDFLPNYCFNNLTNRFVKQKFLPTDDTRQKPPNRPPQYVYGSKQFNAIYGVITDQYTGFIGPHHFRVMARMLGYQGISIIVKEILEIVNNHIISNILESVTLLHMYMPRNCKMQSYSYGSSGIFAYYTAHLNDVLKYPAIRTEIFNFFREFGNAILFCFHVEQNLTFAEVSDLLMAAPFYNNIDVMFETRKEKEELYRKQELEVKYKNLHIIKMIETSGTPEQLRTAREAELLTNERLCCGAELLRNERFFPGLSIFEKVLQQVKQFLTDRSWKGRPPPNGVMNIDETEEFHRLWSALQFVYCMPVGEHEIPPEELFGDGLNWAGCVIISLLDQRRRFELLDFCYHLLYVQRHDGKDGTELSGGGKAGGLAAALPRMIKRIQRVKDLNGRIFCTLSKYKHSGTQVIPVTMVKGFQPPIHQSMTGTNL